MALLNKVNKHWLIMSVSAYLFSCSPQQKTEEQLPIYVKPPIASPVKDSQLVTAANEKPESPAGKPERRIKRNKDKTDYQRKIAGFTFEAFPVKERYHGKAATLDLVSHEDARYYQKTLTRGLAVGSNFAGKFTLVSIDCGPACQLNYVVETPTGKITDKVQSNSGVSFRSDSRLLIVNPPKPTPDYPACSNCGPEVYVLEHGLLYKAKLVR